MGNYNKYNFIFKSSHIHHDKYDYSKTEYVDSKTKVNIICPIHGLFSMRPNDHIQGQGCPTCAVLRRSDKRKMSNNDFIQEANIEHGNKYVYSKVEYVNNHTKVCIICPKHGMFLQRPSSHLNGYGCPKCSKCHKLSDQEFIERSIIVHGNKYDYSKTKYDGFDKKVVITCLKHGEFKQTPHHHLNGVGCPLCKESKLEKEINKLLNDHGIIFTRQTRFLWLGRLSLDFYLPDYKIAIECQGEQHFDDTKFNRSKDTYIKTFERDKRKYGLCHENGINIYYFTLNKAYDNYPYFSKIYTDGCELINQIKNG